MRILGVTASGFFDPAAYELIETAIVSGSSTGTVTFSNLGTYSSTYKHLQLRAVMRTNRTAGPDELVINFNGDTSSSYNAHALSGRGTSPVLSYAHGTTGAIYYTFTSSEATASGIFTPAVIDISDPFSTSKNKTTRSFHGGREGFGEVALVSGGYFKTDSITSISLAVRYGSAWIAGSRFSLYGIKGE